MPLRVLPDTFQQVGSALYGGVPPYDLQFATDGRLYGVYADGDHDARRCRVSLLCPAAPLQCLTTG